MIERLRDLKVERTLVRDRMDAEDHGSVPYLTYKDQWAKLGREISRVQLKLDLAEIRAGEEEPVDR